MADAGFGNLGVLRGLVLAEEQSSLTDWDTALQQIGLGVVQAFEGYCGRKFYRQTSIVEEMSLVGSTLQVQRYPIESVTSVQYRTDEDDSYSTGEIQQVSESAGLIYCYEWFRLGYSVKVTYDGGYWWDTSDDDSGSLPEGATAIPDDLVDAWAAQVQHVAEARNIFGGAAAAANPKKGDQTAANLDFIPYVSAVLDRYRNLTI